ncbi:MAG: hypothetical protein OEL53_18450 [Rhodospirillales bacterium]|nr:hypothetical protein [Rhodospirillales bacterium]
MGITYTAVRPGSREVVRRKSKKARSFLTGLSKLVEPIGGCLPARKPSDYNDLIQPPRHDRSTQL